MADQPERIPMPRVIGNLPVSGYEPPEERTRLHKLADELDRKPLTEVAFRLARLTYGEMKEFAGGIGGDMDKIWEWATKDQSQ